MSRLFAAAACEIVEFHTYLEELFTLRTRDLQRCESAFSPNMTMVAPDGNRRNRADILKGLEKARADAGFKITISDMELLREDEKSALIHYVEQQYRDGETSRRRSTAFFEAEVSAPCGVVWRHLHETWMQDTEA